MVRWVFRCGKTCLGAVVGLAALISLAEVGLRIAAFSQSPAPSQNLAPVPLAVPSWVTGWEFRPLQRTTVRPETDEPFVFRTNRWGLRGEDLAVPKPAGVFRIVCLGGPHIVAPMCPEPQSFCVQLHGALQSGVNYPIEVVNAGLPLGGPSIALIQWERMVAAMQPDAVLVMMDADDLRQDVTLRKRMTRDRHGFPVSCAPVEDAPPKSPNIVIQLRKEFRLMDWACQRLAQELSQQQASSATVSASRTELPRDQVVRALTPLRELQRRCEAANTRMLIVAAPARGNSFDGTNKESGAVLSDTAFFAALGELLTQTGITGIDATGVFRKGEDAAGGHWSTDEEGDLAALVAQGLRERLPGPWSSPYFQNGGVTPASHRQPGSR